MEHVIWTQENKNSSKPLLCIICINAIRVLSINGVYTHIYLSDHPTKNKYLIQLQHGGMYEKFKNED